MHNMGLNWPVFISYVISIMDECFFFSVFEWNTFYHLLFQVFIKYIALDYLFILPFF